MNKCIKVTIKNCDNIDKYKNILKDLRYQSWLASNKAITYTYIFALENMEYKKLNGININEKDRFGKSYGAWVENRMNEIMNIHNSGNVAQTRQFVSNRFKDDVKKGLFKGKVSVSNFKQSIPIVIHNKNYKIIQGNKGFEVECSLFNRNYQKENNVKTVHFIIDSLNNSQKAILNKIILGIYKQGSVQIAEDRKSKWYFTISFSFEKEESQLDKNKILGVDLGIVNTATMQAFDIITGKWDKMSWKDCVVSGKELIHFRQTIQARRRQIGIATKIVGEGRIGHGTKTRIKPLDKLKHIESNFKNTYNHKISKYIVDTAIKFNCATIQMEDLSGYSAQQTESMLKNWSYFDLQTKVKYKAEEKGINFILIDPKYTSKRCSKCGCIHPDNRDGKKNQAKFECVRCGYKENADINAAKNISMPDIVNIIEEELKRIKSSDQLEEQVAM